jgi:hypothetical protein
MAPRLRTSVTGVAKALPDSWAEQEERIGLAGFEAEWLVQRIGIYDDMF